MAKTVRCGRAESGEILAILNEAIANTTALYDYSPRSPASMEAWFDAKDRGRYPIIGLKDDRNELLAFGSYGPFRAWPAYKYTVEHSLYVRSDRRRMGFGRIILLALEEAAIAQGYHNLIAAIDASNDASIALHNALGFQHCGLIKHAGFKFGRWLDLALYQKILPGPENPKDG